VAVLHQERIGAQSGDKTVYGMQVELRAWETTKAKTSPPAKIPAKLFETITRKITGGVPGVVSVTYNVMSLPPAVAETV
jgi:GMP synthase PP-ATPase subunit